MEDIFDGITFDEFFIEIFYYDYHHAILFPKFINFETLNTIKKTSHAGGIFETHVMLPLVPQQKERSCLQ